MIFNRMFQKHYAVTALVVLIFVVLGFFTTSFIMRISMQSEMAGMRLHHPSKFIAQLVDRISGQDPSKRPLVLEEVLHWEGGPPPMKLLIINEEGKVVYPAGESAPEDWQSMPKPTQPYADSQPQGKPFGSFLVRFQGNPAEYLFAPEGGPGPPGPPIMHGLMSHPGLGPPAPEVLLFAIGPMLISVLLGIGLSTMLLFRSLGEKAKLADSVIAELQRGNLKARFPISKMDEMGKAMQRFNLMADEISHLVERVQSSEKARMGLLQELAHDLRTPVASLKSLLENLEVDDEPMEPALHSELTTLALKEIDYFERLVEDLLVLAQVSEPRYQPDSALVTLNPLLEDEAESVHARYSPEISLVKDIPEGAIHTLGDPHLLRRLFRNAIENAFSFARGEVRVSLKNRTDGNIEILVQDDGPGFSPEGLKSFGERRVTRAISPATRDRVSIGLGSVIMKAVAQVHRGSVIASNRVESDGKVVGAEVLVTLANSSR
jgi:signal transduction histidine kinase